MKFRKKEKVVSQGLLSYGSLDNVDHFTPFIRKKYYN